ncbi:hypothetical protein RBG61_11990 [Paludicola sp. MB14-C6]|uniref:hypothetical protein n=1 Tax=Paludihabitans sp. MB14-C6 TaxID=3070656 RepID=UPI0027DB1408|nr:hypothetical protein [Paludicola sp. MB14-C6]WMJ22704.1 hypothetical protein RBG61_11990 [Paludicola sp. MB14-C6]
MNKIKNFVQQNKVIVLIVAALLLVAVFLIIFFSVKHDNKPDGKFIATGATPSNQALENVSKFTAPSSNEDTSSQNTSSAASSTIKVDGEVSSKANTSSSKITVSAPPKASTTSKPTPPPPSKPKPPVSSTPTLPPTHEVDPVTPPVNPDPNGPQHGDTREINGKTKYFHIGMNAYISDWMWENWGNYPQAKSIKTADGYSAVDTSFMQEGEKQYIKSMNYYIVWCKVQNSWVVEKSYNYNSHTGNDHGQPR